MQNACSDILQSVGKGVSQFQICRCSGLVHVVARNGNGIELRHLFRAVFEDNATGEREEVWVEGKSPVLFRTEANVTHAFKNESDNDLYLLCYEKREGDIIEQDIYRKVILM